MKTGVIRRLFFLLGPGWRSRQLVPNACIAAIVVFSRSRVSGIHQTASSCAHAPARLSARVRQTARHLVAKEASRSDGAAPVTEKIAFPKRNRGRRDPNELKKCQLVRRRGLPNPCCPKQSSANPSSLGPPIVFSLQSSRILIHPHEDRSTNFVLRREAS